MATPVRRSTRQRTANKRYSGTDWDRATLRALRESDQSSGSSPSDSDNAGTRRDENFNSRQRRSEVAVQWTDDDAFSDISAESANRTSFKSDEVDLNAIRWGPDGQPGYMDGTSVAGIKRPSKRNHSLRSQGIRPLHKTSKDWTYQAFGSDLQDLEPILVARETWLRGRDITLPSRLSLADSNLDHDFANDLIQESSVPEGALARNQTSNVVQPSAADIANTLASGSSHSVVLGPTGKQHLHRVDYLQALDVSKIWLQTSSAPRHGPKSSPAATSDQGWILNVGLNIQSMNWLPSKDHKVQFLAISVQTGQTAPLSPINTTPPTIDSPNPQASSLIQIWAFESSHEADGDHGAMHQSVLTAPRLHSMRPVASDVHQLQWQPGPSDAEDGRRLAILFADGAVKLLYITLFEPSESTQMLEKGSKPEIICPSSKSLFTAISWLSELDLILGDAEGKIYIFNTKQSLTEPYLSLHIHNASINSVVPAQSPEIPTLIVSSSTLGVISLTDLRAPSQDSVHIRDSSHTQTSPIYCLLTRSFVTTTQSSRKTIDQNNSCTLIRCHHLRHFSSPAPVCYIPRSSGSAIVLTNSPHHPCILIGTEKGSVYATNYLRTVLSIPTKKTTEKTGGYLQKVFEYDWRDLSDEERRQNAEKNGREQQTKRQGQGQDQQIDQIDFRAGMSRITENFLPEPTSLPVNIKMPQDVIDWTSTQEPHNPAEEGPTSGKQDRGHEEEGAGKSPFSNEQAVTALEWNPNRHCAGWVAVGWGSGLVRVMDLSHDAK